MKTIAQFVNDQINNLPDLKDALQTAMRLEFSTIPPYLCAQWSIQDDHGQVAKMIKRIVKQEMFHFALAGNMLTSTGGSPDIANSSFIPTYPTNVLPGGIPQHLPVDLQPLTPNQAQVFMQIEYPGFPSVADVLAPATIGAFYTAIAAGFKTVQPAINANAFAVNLHEAKPIKSVADALAAIALIQAEGEGTQGSPDQPPGGVETFAHYYVFKEIYTQKTLVKDAAGSWSFSGPPINFPTCYVFKQSNSNPSPSVEFNKAMTQLLIQLQTCWTSGARPDTDAMHILKTLGTGLIQKGIRPEFLWTP